MRMPSTLKSASAVSMVGDSWPLRNARGSKSRCSAIWRPRLDDRQVRRVRQQVGPDLTRYVGERLEIERPAVRARSRYYHLRPLAQGYVPNAVHVDELGVGLHPVGDYVVLAAGEVEGMPVREVSAVREVHGEYLRARLEHREEYRHVGLRARMGLNVGVVGPEEPLAPLHGEVLNVVHRLAAAVVPRAGIALGVLVGEHRTRRREHRPRHHVFRGNKLYLRPLPRQLRHRRHIDGGIRIRQGLHSGHLSPFRSRL